MPMTEKMTSIQRRITNAVHQMIRSHCAETGDIETDIAHDMGVSASYLNNLSNGYHQIRADHVVRLTRLLGATDIIGAMCGLCGGIFVSTPNLKDATNAKLLAAAANVSKESGKAVETLLRAMSDGKVDAIEREECLATFDHAIRVMDACRKQIHSFPVINEEDLADARNS